MEVEEQVSLKSKSVEELKSNLRIKVLFTVIFSSGDSYRDSCRLIT